MTIKKNSMITGLALGIGMFSFANTAQAMDLYTGEQSGAYYNDFCPAITAAAKEKNVSLNCKTSNGSINNLSIVAENPASFGLAQYDVFSSKYSDTTEQHTYTPIRDDLGNECLFMVTKNKLLSNIGDVASSAAYLNFVLPPENSGHAGTFKFLQTIDPTGLGKAANVTHAASTHDAITTTLASEDGVTLFVQFPNPDSEIFKLVNANGGHFIPVISREILSKSTKGRKVYSAQETEVANPDWHKSGKKVVTACTPIVLFTGKSSLIADESLKAEHMQAIVALQQIPAKDLTPQQGWFSKLWTSTKALSAASVEGLIVASEKAKEASSPYLEKAKEVTQDAVDAAKPTYDKAVEAVKPTYDKAVEAVKPTYDKAVEAVKPTYDKAVEKTKEAMEAAKPTYDKAVDKTKEVTKDAMEAAKPTYEKAKKKTKQAMEAAKPTLDKAVEKTKEVTKDAMEAAKPTYEKAKEKTKQAMEAAKPTLDKAKETTKSYYQQAVEYSKRMLEKAGKMLEDEPESEKAPVTN